MNTPAVRTRSIRRVEAVQRSRSALLLDRKEDVAPDAESMAACKAMDCTPVGLRGTLLCGHAALTALAVVMLVFWPPDGSRNELFLALILAYSGLIAALIVRIDGPFRVSSLFGIAMSFTYVAYFVKVVIYLISPEFFFPDFISSGSPLGQATSHEWCTALGLFFMGTVGMVLGAYLAGNWGLGRGHAVAAEWSPMQSQRQRRIVTQFLLMGAAMVVFRWFATAILGLGASYSESEMILGFAGVAGTIQLFTLWGGRLIVATACGAALATGRWSVLGMAFLELLLFGGLSTIYTGSKSEVLLPLVIVAIVTVRLRSEINRKVYRVLMLGAAAGLLVVVSVYPAFHEYRYLRFDMTIDSYLAEYREQMRIEQGLQQVTRRLTGMEGLVMVTTYLAHGYPAPPLGLNYGDFFTYEVWGIPSQMGIGLEMGFLGGILAIGGPFGLLAASVFLGFAFRIMDHMLERFSSNSAARQALHATLAVWLLVFLLFSGNLLANVKELFSIGLGALVVRIVIGGVARFDNTELRDPWSATEYC